MDSTDKDQLLTLINHTVEKHGCKIVEIDLENRILNIEGPDEAQLQCAVALGELLE